MSGNENAPLVIEKLAGRNVTASKLDAAIFGTQVAYPLIITKMHHERINLVGVIVSIAVNTRLDIHAAAP